MTVREFIKYLSDLPAEQQELPMYFSSMSDWEELEEDDITIFLSSDQSYVRRGSGIMRVYPSWVAKNQPVEYTSGLIIG